MTKLVMLSCSCLSGMLGREIAQRVEHAALRSRRRMRQVEVIEIRAAAASERHELAVQLAPAVTDPGLHDVAQRDDAETSRGNLPQVGGERLEVIRAIVVPVNVHRLVGENGDSHEGSQRESGAEC